MFGRKKGDFLLPLVFYEKEKSKHYRAVILNIKPNDVKAVSNDRALLFKEKKSLMQKEFFLDFNFFDIDTTDIKGKIISMRHGLFHGHEIVLHFNFTDIDMKIRRDINRIIQAQRIK